MPTHPVWAGDHDPKEPANERKSRALSFVKEELPGANVWADAHEPPTEILVIEGADEAPGGRISSVCDTVGKIVSSVRGVIEYPNGAEIYFTP